MAQKNFTCCGLSVLLYKKAAKIVQCRADVILSAVGLLIFKFCFYHFFLISASATLDHNAGGHYMFSEHISEDLIVHLCALLLPQLQLFKLSARVYSCIPFRGFDPFWVVTFNHAVFVIQGLVGFCLAIQPTDEDMGTIGRKSGPFV